MKNDDAMMGYFLLVKYSLFCLPKKYEKVDPELGFVAFLAVALLILYFYRRGEGGGGGSEGTLYNLVQRLRVMTILKRFF